MLASASIQTKGANPGKVWNPFDLKMSAAAKKMFTTASDHFPVTLDIA